MVIPLIMPQFGEGIEEATIIKWLKSEGDTVAEYEALVEVNTDKVDTEIPAPESGTLLKIVQSQEGTIVSVGMILAWIGQPGEFIPEVDITANLNSQVGNHNKEIPPTITGRHKSDPDAQHLIGHKQEQDSIRDLGFVSPLVAKIASEQNLNLQHIFGTGFKGRITKNDVLSYIETQKQELVEKNPTKTEMAQPINDHITLIPHSAIRRRIADHMVMSKRSSPHVTTVFEADLSKIVEHRTINKDAFSRDNARLTFTAYFIAATAASLKTFPMVNSSWRDDSLLIHRKINIGMATSLGEEGLIVPVIKNADELSLLGIARSVNDLATRARQKQLLPDEVDGGTFTITNHGVSGSLFAMPIINQPQCAILGVGKLNKRVIVLEDNLGYDTIAVRPMVYLTLTFDHRILDGAIADYFLSKVVETLEKWT